MFVKELKKDRCRCSFWLFGGDLKKEMDIDPSEILRRLGGG